MDWYYAENKKRVGPFNDIEFRSLVSKGKIDKQTLVWNETLTDWTPFKKVTLPEPEPVTIPEPTPMSDPTSGQPFPTTEPDAFGLSTKVCSQCGKTFPEEELAVFSNSLICAACKPVFVQKLKEGVSTADMRYAGFWIRFGAKIIDGIIMTIFSVIINFIFGMVMVMPGQGMNPDQMGSYMAVGFIAAIIQWGLNILYVTWFLGRFGATPGKMACGLTVVTAENEKISYLRAFARFFSEFLSGIIFFIGYIMAAFDSEKRALHDRICNTRVVKK